MAASVVALQSHSPDILWLSAYDPDGLTIVAGTPDTASEILDFSGNGFDGVTYGFGSPEMDGAYTTHYGPAAFPICSSVVRHRYITTASTLSSVTLAYMGPMTPTLTNTGSEVQLIHTGLGFASLHWRWASGDTRQVWWSTSPGVTAAVADVPVVSDWPASVADEDAVVIYGITRAAGSPNAWRLIAAYGNSEGLIAFAEEYVTESATGPTTDHTGIMNEGQHAAGMTMVAYRAMDRAELVDTLVEMAEFHSVTFAAELAEALREEEETELLYENLRKHIPRERVPSAEPLLRSAASVFYQIRAAIRRTNATATRLGATGRWLDLYAASFGYTRLPDETDSEFQERLVDFDTDVTLANVGAAVEALMGAFFTFYEWFEYPLCVIPEAEDSLAYGFYASVSRLPLMGGFILQLPGGTTSSIGLQVINAVNEHKALGIPWLIILDDYLGEVTP